MRRILILSIAAITVAAGLVACGDNGTNVNTARMTNTAANAANTLANSVVTAANTIANSVSKATTDSPKDFMTAAAQGGMAEVELGKLAAKKATNPEVKKFGQMMVEDHTKINNDLKDLAKKKNIELPADMGSHKSTMDKLSAMSGADFDKAYVNDMVDDHEADVAEFQKQADNATDPDVKAFAAKSLAVIKRHLDAIKAIQAKMK